MEALIDKILDWPDGVVWRLARGPILRAIHKKHKTFMAEMKPAPFHRVLDVGAAPHKRMGFNFLEQWYPWPEQITAVALDPTEGYEEFSRLFTGVRLVFADGKDLPFADGHFDIVVCNAVLEHAGTEEDQRRLLREVIRVGRQCFITTPNASFPLDTHTMFPLVHYLPLASRFWVYRHTGQERFADLRKLNLLGQRRLLALFPGEARVRLIKQRILGLVSGFIAVVQGPRHLRRIS